MRFLRFIFVLLILPNFAEAETKIAETMNDVQKIIEEALQKFEAPDIVTVFDVDYTLTYPEHPTCNLTTIYRFKSTFKNLFKDINALQKDAVITLMTQVTKQKLIDKDAPKILKDIQTRGVKTMALTATLAGKVLGAKQKLVVLRRDQLQKLGIDFTYSFKSITLVNPIQNLPMYANYYPIFFHGFMSSNGEGKYNKGEVFSAFLKKISTHKLSNKGYRPKCIIFVDDKQQNIDDMEKHLKEYDPTLIFIGIKFTGALKIQPSQEVSEPEFQAFWQKLIDDPRVKQLKA